MGSKRSLSPPLPGRLVTGLTKIGLALKTQAWVGAGEHGLPPTQAQILTLLKARGALRLAQLALELGVTAPTASDAVSSLVEKGLVAKERDLRDARAIALTLTAAGRRQCQSVGDWPDALLESVAVLSTAEQETLLLALVKLIHALQQREAIPLARMCVSCRFFRPHEHPGSAQPHHCAFIDAPLAQRDLRLDCGDYDLADERRRQQQWRRFSSGGAKR